MCFRPSLTFTPVIESSCEGSSSKAPFHTPFFLYMPWSLTSTALQISSIQLPHRKCTLTSLFEVQNQDTTKILNNIRYINFQVSCFCFSKFVKTSCTLSLTLLCSLATIAWSWCTWTNTPYGTLSYQYKQSEMVFTQCKKEGRP